MTQPMTFFILSLGLGYLQIQFGLFIAFFHNLLDGLRLVKLWLLLQHTQCPAHLVEMPIALDRDDANHLLARGRIVVGATQSGGLWFLGVPRARVELLSALAAGGARPLELIKRKALELDADVDLLATMRTIETDTDLWLAAQQCDDLKRFLAGLDAA